MNGNNPIVGQAQKLYPRVRRTFELNLIYEQAAVVHVSFASIATTWYIIMHCTSVCYHTGALYGA